jgi:hypothetical protein
MMTNSKNKQTLLPGADESRAYIKIRKQVADDFHDMGNKLTRIILLSDILEYKSDEQDTEYKQLIAQLKENADGLYIDMKEMIWSLDPQTNNLFEVLSHIRYFAIDVFENTKTSLVIDDFKAGANLFFSLQATRIITGIFKELLFYISTQLDTEIVVLKCFETERELKLIVFADGKAFDTIIKMSDLDEIKIKAKRINWVADIDILPGKGLMITLMPGSEEVYQFINCRI